MLYKIFKIELLLMKNIKIYIKNIYLKTDHTDSFGMVCFIIFIKIKTIQGILR